MKKNIIVILAMLLFVSCNNGWHYETDVEAKLSSGSLEKVKLYSKTINDAVVFQIKTKEGEMLPVIPNPHFGNDNFSNYKYKYKSQNYFSAYSFNMPGEDVQKELEIIKSKKWQLLRGIRVYTDFDDISYANLYWRNYDQKFMIVPCGKNAKWQYKNSISYYEEPLNRREIIVNEENHSYAKYDHLLGRTMHRNFTHRAAEFSLMVNKDTY